MPIQIIPKAQQATGAFNGGEITENKPVGLPREGGVLRPYSSVFYWAHADAHVDSTIGLHPHQGFEILSFVLAGTIRHYDTKLDDWRELHAGDVQIIRAGNGISHAEWMGRGSQMFQIWLDPNLNDTLNDPASYDDYAAASFPVRKRDTMEEQILIGDNAPLSLKTPGVRISRYRILQKTWRLELDPELTYGIYQLAGRSRADGHIFETRDFVRVTNESVIEFIDCADAEFFVLAVPTRLDYLTYAARMRYSTTEE